jgi:hypothetical protein
MITSLALLTNEQREFFAGENDIFLSVRAHNAKRTKRVHFLQTMLVSYVIAAIVAAALPRSSVAYFSVPYDESIPSFLKLAHAADWAEDKGPLRSDPVMTVLNWGYMFPWDRVNMMGDLPDYIETDLGACRMSTDRSLMSTADVVWFQWEYQPQLDLERWLVPRPHGALWMYYTANPPTHTERYHPLQLKALNSSINMLMTYQHASDIIVREFGFLARRPAELAHAVVPDWSKKTKFMVAMNSDSKEAPWRNARILVCSLSTGQMTI